MLSHSSHESEFMILFILQIFAQKISLGIVLLSNFFLTHLGFISFEDIDLCVQYLTHLIQCLVAIAGAVLIRYKWINRNKK